MMWLTKDQTMPEPVILSPEAEKGSYVFFNHNAWQRVRVSRANSGLLSTLTSLSSRILSYTTPA